jgi:O-antigen ligase
MRAAQPVALERPRIDLAAVGALIATALVAGPLVVAAPFAFTALLLGGTLLYVAVTRPLVVLCLALVIGPIDLSFLTGGLRGLLPQLGGLDMNGVRLIGVSSGLALASLVLPRARETLTGRNGIFYVLFLVWAALSLLWSPNRIDGLRLWLHIAYPLLIVAAIVGSVEKRADLDRLVDFALIGAALVAFVLNPYFALHGGYEVYESGHLRVRGVGAHENPIAFYMLISMFMSFMRLLIRRQTRYALLCAGLGFWVVLTLSRITFLAALVGLGGIAVYALISLRNPRVMTAAVMAAVLLAVPLVPAIMERTFGHSMSPGELISLMRSPLALYESINWHGRELAWPVVFAAFLSAPWSGLGMGSSMLIMRQYFPPEVGPLVHNDYLRLAVETGVTGVILFAIALFTWLVVVIRSERAAQGRAREYAVPALAGLLAWGTIAITDNALNFAPFTQSVALLVGATIACTRLRLAEPT